MRFITLKKFCEMTGFAPKTIYNWISAGKWSLGSEYLKPSHKCVVVDLEGYSRWIQRG